MSKKVDPAVRWLSKLVDPLPPIEFLLGQASSLLAESGQLEPPFSPQKAVPASVKSVEIARISRDGMLIPVEGGFIIKLNSEKPRVRQDFACAHEIGHTFFYDLSGNRPWRPSESMSFYWGEENLCYQFAEEMLMPRLWIERTAGMCSPSILNFQKLRKTFQVSIEALARRIVRLNLWRCILIIFTEDNQNTNLLKRKVVGRHRTYKYSQIKWNWLLSRDSSPCVAFRNPGILNESTVKGHDLFRRGKRNSDWHIESYRFGGTISPIVVSIILPKDYSELATPLSL